MGELAKYLSEEYTKKIQEMVRITNRIAYHYTSPEGLKCILQNSSIWFGDFRFLNDIDEITYATNMMDIAIDSRKDEINCTAYEELKKLCSNPINYIYHSAVGGDSILPRLYILSLSEIDDSLNMWNYYGKSSNKAGYSIGMDLGEIKTQLKSSLASCRHRNTSGVGRVIYDYDSQNLLVNMFVDYLVKIFPISKACSQSEWNKEFANFRTSLLNLMVYLKDYKFASEKEVRYAILISEEDVCQLQNIVFPTNLGFFSPKLEIRGNNIAKSIKEIVSGPYNTKELSELGLNEIIRYTGLDAQVRSSNAKVRF